MVAWEFGSEHIVFTKEEYTDGKMGVEAWCEDGPFARISVNIPGAPILGEGQFYLKDWSENEDLAKAMIKEKIITKVEPEVTIASGHITATAYQFTELGKQYCDPQSEIDETPKEDPPGFGEDRPTWSHENGRFTNNFPWNP